MVKLLKLCFHKQKTYFHIRYLKWRGFALTIPIYCILIILCKLSKTQITWTCHNIWEHRFPSRLQNYILRNIIYFFSSSVIVMHNDLIDYLPKYARNKIVIANFGDFKALVESETIINSDFQKRYSDWKIHQRIGSPDVIFISATYLAIGSLLRIAGDCSDSNFLFIAPGANCYSSDKHIFLYTQSQVTAEVNNLFQEGQPIGLISHDNISVPTSVYMFASYGIPILAYDIKPLNSLIKEYNMGLLFDYNSNLSHQINIIKSNYEFYRKNSRRFIDINSWDKSSIKHSHIWK